MRTRRIKNLVGPQVRHLRNERGWSQPAFAAECQRRGWDIDRDTVAKIEGRSRWVSDFELILLGRILGVPLDLLLPVNAATNEAVREFLERPAPGRS